MIDINAKVVISMPSQLFTLANSFEAAANGKIYIGKIDTDPTIPTNQIQVYIKNSDGSTVPVTQPITINAGGYPVYNGQIAKFVTVEGYSMAVYDSNNVRQFYYPNVLKYDPDLFSQRLSEPDGLRYVGEVLTFAGLRLIEPSANGQRINLKQHSPATTPYVIGRGGGVFRADLSSTEADDDGTCAVTANGARWIREDRAGNSANMGWWGAHGDNANIDAQVVKILTYAKRSKCNIYIPDGAYRVSPLSGTSAFDIGVPISVVGESCEKTLIYNDGQGDVFRFSSATGYLVNYGLRDLTIIGNWHKTAHTGTTGKGIVLNKCGNGGTFRDITVMQCEYGLSSADSYTVNLYNCRFQWNGKWGMYTQSASNSWGMHSCQFNFNGQGGARAGGTANGFYACNFEGNDGPQVAVNGASAVIDSAYIEKLSYEGIVIDGCNSWRVSGGYINELGSVGTPTKIIGIHVINRSSNGTVTEGTLFREKTDGSSVMVAVVVEPGSNNNTFWLPPDDKYENNGSALNRRIFNSLLPQSIYNTGQYVNGAVITHNFGVDNYHVSAIHVGTEPLFVSITNRTANTFTLGLLNKIGEPITSLTLISWSVCATNT